MLLKNHSYIIFFLNSFYIYFFFCVNACACFVSFLYFVLFCFVLFCFWRQGWFRTWKLWGFVRTSGLVELTSDRSCTGDWSTCGVSAADWIRSIRAAWSTTRIKWKLDEYGGRRDRCGISRPIRHPTVGKVWLSFRNWGNRQDCAGPTRRTGEDWRADIRTLRPDGPPM